ncbi:MAG: phenylacetate--CoA ligase family protein [Verrucomicrobiia bacterium]
MPPFATRSEIRAAQLAELQTLVSLAASTNPFYAAKFTSAGVCPRPSNLPEFCAFPFTTKVELVEDQKANPPFGTNLSFPLDRYSRHHQTSGTTGMPLRWLDTPESWNWMVDRWIEIFHAAAVTPADRIMFAFSFGPFIGFWLAFEAGARIGALCLPAGGLSSSARVRMILETGATVLCCTPTYAIRLAEVARDEGIDLASARIRRIIVAGEPGGSIPSTRARLEALWPGARVFDHHGMTETGPVSFECPAKPGFLHVMESGFIAEVLDPVSGRPCAPGEPGELILTNLGRLGSPLIRYRTGDIVKSKGPANGQFRASGSTHADVPCACGRHDLLLEGGILGRVDDMLIVRGVNIYPTAIEHILRACGDVGEYQVKVSRSGALSELSILIEPDGACPDVNSLVAKARKELQSAFALRIPVEAVARGTLPRFEMKAKRWVLV